MRYNAQTQQFDYYPLHRTFTNIREYSLEELRNMALLDYGEKGCIYWTVNNTLYTLYDIVFDCETFGRVFENAYEGMNYFIDRILQENP